MSDARLRELRRRWESSGEHSDHAAYLIARIRHGDLEPGQVHKCARLGHPAALLVAEQPEPPLARSANEGAALLGLYEWSHEELVRAAIAVSRRLVEAPARLEHLIGEVNVRRIGQAPPRSRARRALDAVEAWVLAGCGTTGRNQMIRWDPNRTPDSDKICGLEDRPEEESAAYTIGVALGVSRGMGPDPVRRLVSMLEVWMNMTYVEIEAYQAFRDAIDAELTPWWLGYSDPLGVRAETLQSRRAS